jgi:hypothetical protein
VFDTLRGVDRSRFAIVLPDDADLIGRVMIALAAQSDPPISVSRSGQAVLAFESTTGDMMLRSRVIQALELAAGPDWHARSHNRSADRPTVRTCRSRHLCLGATVDATRSMVRSKLRRPRPTRRA